MKILRTVTMIAAALLCAGQAAALKLPGSVASHMVLQQRAQAALWGWAKPGSTVKVTNSWSKQKYTATAEGNGRWKLAIATPAASYEPQSITIEGDGQKVKVNDVLIGEVWFAGGQSNMTMKLQGNLGQPIDGAAQAIAYSGQNKGKIRILTVNEWNAYSKTPIDSVAGTWQVSCPDNAPGFSAIGYFYAEALNKLLNMPVGVIVCAWGGTFEQEWIPDDVRKAMPEYNPQMVLDFLTACGVKRVEERDLFNTMVYGVKDYTIKGFLWNQGECNAMMHDMQYASRFAKLVKAWRDAFGQGNLPMHCVELPGFGYDGRADGTMGALTREMQWKGAELAGNCYMISAIDCMHPFQMPDIHGSVKQPIGERLAFQVASKSYGMKNVPADYARYKSVDLQGNKAVVRFSDYKTGLTPNHDMQGFEVAGSDHKFYPATATESWDDAGLAVTVTSDKVSDIKAVRYCFKNWVIGPVHDSMGLPLVPFRTDDWAE